MRRRHPFLCVRINAPSFNLSHAEINRVNHGINGILWRFYWFLIEYQFICVNFGAYQQKLESRVSTSDHHPPLPAGSSSISSIAPSICNNITMSLSMGWGGAISWVCVCACGRQSCPLWLSLRIYCLLFIVRCEFICTRSLCTAAVFEPLQYVASHNRIHCLNIYSLSRLSR